MPPLPNLPIESRDAFPLVPPGVLSVLPGFGATTGVEIVKNPFIRKVDITVSHACHWRTGTSERSVIRPVRKLVAVLEALLDQTWLHTVLSWVERSALSYLLNYSVSVTEFRRLRPQL